MELIFEIGCEELPARFVDPALEQMRGFFRQKCEQERIEVDGIRTVGTPRRLTLLVEELAEYQDDLETEQTGPPAETAFDEGGEPTAAAEGFASAHGVDPSDLYVAETDKGEFAALRVRDEGERAVDLLPAILDELIRELDFPKSMRWADHTERFGRPVRWLVAVAGGEVVPVSFAGVDSGAETRGHQFKAPEPFEVRSIDEYESGLKEAWVVPDPEERRAQIEQKLDELADEVDSEVVDDPELVDEVVHLIEYPLATRLDYDEKYLELPREVLVTSMRSHQRYFAFEDPQTGELTPHCGVIYNTPVEDSDVVNQGNLRVLRARLEDAMFFWENDRERTLESRLEDLERVVWIDELDETTRDRAERIADAANRLGARYLDDDNYAAALASSNFSDASALAARAGLLSKSDLVTDMVEEFPKLQGIMGREYARADGEPEPVADAIGEQYLPGG
ncbi:MAG: glycine--tRNA ligase subunit beta, partial [Bradymonadaceae bacterium]